MLLNRHKNIRQGIKTQATEKQPVKPVKEEKKPVKKSRK